MQNVLYYPFGTGCDWFNPSRPIRAACWWAVITYILIIDYMGRLRLILLILFWICVGASVIGEEFTV
jgi:hypothetical protein